MSDTAILRIIQTVHVSHNDTIARSWYDVVERTIERTIDAQGNIIDEEIMDDTVVEEMLGLEEETIATDEDTEPDEIMEEEIEDDE